MRYTLLLPVLAAAGLTAIAQSGSITIVSHGPSVVTPGGRIDLVLRLTNTGQVPWTPPAPDGCRQLLLSDNIHDTCPAYPAYAGYYAGLAGAFKTAERPSAGGKGWFASILLPTVIEPGQTIEIHDHVLAPFAPGSYTMYFTMVRYAFYQFLDGILQSFDQAFAQTQSFEFVVAEDVTPPSILFSGLLAGTCRLEPPNGLMIEAGSVSASDGGTGLRSLDVSVTSDDPSTLPSDIVVSGSGTDLRSVQLRAKRAGATQGRTYSVRVEAADQAGNVATSSAACVVPHDQGAK